MIFATMRDFQHWCQSFLDLDEIPRDSQRVYFVIRDFNSQTEQLSSEAYRWVYNNIYEDLCCHFRIDPHSLNRDGFTILINTFFQEEEIPLELITGEIEIQDRSIHYDTITEPHTEPQDPGGD
jgi:hypothetical protein